MGAASAASGEHPVPGRWSGRRIPVHVAIVKGFVAIGPPNRLGSKDDGSCSAGYTVFMDYRTVDAIG